MMRHAFARQLANPSGVFGWAVGKLMKRANRLPTQLAIDALAVEGGDHVLDMGCGAGQAIAAIVPSVGSGAVHGIDQSDLMVSEATRLNRKAIADGKATVRMGAFERIPFPDGMFDKILATNVMYFWHDPTRVLGEIRRVLIPGGRLAIYLTDAATMRHWKIAEAGHHKLFDAAEVANALREGGFAPGTFSVKSVPITSRVNGLLAVAER